LDTRILLAVVLSLAAIFAYQEFVLKRLYPPQEQAPIAGPKVVPSAMPTAAPPAIAAGRPAAIPVQGSAEPRSFTVETTNYIARFDTQGGRLESFRLKHFRQTAAPRSPLEELVTPGPDGELPLGLVIEQGTRTLDDRQVVYNTSAPVNVVLQDNQSATVQLSASAPGGLQLSKRLEFHGDSYVFNVDAAISGPPGAITAAGLTMTQPLGHRTGYNDVPEVQVLVNGKTTVEAEKALRKKPQPLRGKVTYAGLGDLYFLTAYLPQMAQEGTVATTLHEDLATATILYAAQNGDARIATQVYMGPKELTTLEAVNPQLRRAINFGWAGVLALAFLRALKIFHHITPNYGVDIILLTVAIRLVLLPMSIKSQRSMMRLQRLQPQVERLREKFKDDRERLNREMIDIYKRNHVNPLGGCAPMLLQLPIFLGLYEALANSIELRHAPFIGWIRDLSAPECLVIPGMPQLPFLPCGGLPILVILMGGSTWLQQYLSPQPPDPNQAKMMMLMPLMFTVMFMNLPAGLTLYYFASNVLGIIQQYILNREFKQFTPVNA
jgi:YidC/Oxa1 family membrane protein insertase